MRYRQIIEAGLWSNNPGLSQLLGICPLLAVTNTLINGLSLGLATLMVLCGTNLVVSSARRFIPPAVRLPALVLIIATFVTLIQLVAEAYFFDLYLGLGIFLALIITNCTVLARAEAFASRHGVFPSLLDGLAHGVGFTGLLTALGALREMLGQGSLFAGAQALFGPHAAALKITVGSGHMLFGLAALPAGAFFGLAALIALKNHLTARHHGTTPRAPSSGTTSSR